MIGHSLDVNSASGEFDEMDEVDQEMSVGQGGRQEAWGSLCLGSRAGMGMNQ